MARKALFATMLALTLSLGAMTAALAQEDDRHAGYYYPEPQTSEVYTARVTTLPDSDRNRRIAFVTGLTKQMLGGQYEPSYAVFAKGDEAEKLIIVALADGPLDTIYRARALLAMLTAVARLTPFFQQNTIAEQATFLDLLKLLGYTQVTVSDGDAFAHQISIE
jgi:hypothetical protein